MVTIKTPVRVVTITMTATNQDGTEGVDYAADHIGNLSPSDLAPCDCEGEQHTYHATDEEAQWWIDHCAAYEAMEDRIAELTDVQRARFRDEAERQGTFDVDVGDQPRAGNALMDALFGTADQTDSQQVHVTRVAKNGDVYGHTTDHCNENGCNGDELYFSSLRGSVEAGDGGCVAGEVVDEHD